MRVFTAHDPAAGPTGTDYLITIHDDGSGEFATRPGFGQTWTTWSPPIRMEAREVPA